MTDLELLIFGAMVTFLAVAGAYLAIRHRANESPVDSYKDYAESGDSPSRRSASPVSPQHDIATPAPQPSARS